MWTIFTFEYFLRLEKFDDGGPRFSICVRVVAVSMSHANKMTMSSNISLQKLFE